METAKENTGGQKNTTIFVAVLLFAALFPPALYAAGVTISAPTNTIATSEFKMRTLSINGSQPVPHRGLDYRAPCGTELSPAGGITKCFPSPTYGGVAEGHRGCGVVEQFAHLQGCDSNSGKMTTGGKPGMPGAGTSEACHLHYEIRINGTAVNPASAYGKDLCDAAVRKELIDEAQRILQGKAGGGGGSASGSTPGSVPAPDGSSFTQVPPTETSPGYYSVTTPDGRTYNQGGGGGEEDLTTSVLPPTTDDVVLGGGGAGEITGCAADTWRAMVNQSVLETRREMVMNQRYIAKPDSVFAYSCFSEALDNARQTLGVFSESQLWVNRQVDVLGDVVTLNDVNTQLGPSSLDGALTNAALEPYEAFLRIYNHDLLGGLPTAGGEYESMELPEGSSAQVYLPCGTMMKVWNMARCTNITDDPAFYTFEDLITTDPRKYPPTYACNDTGITQNMIDIAKNKQAEFSEVDTYMTLLYPEPGTCAAPIPTGVTVSRMEGAERIATEKNYPDGYCITQGCSYQNPSSSGMGTCEIKMP